MSQASDLDSAKDSQGKIGLFEDDRQDLLHIHIPLKYNICNFKCSYCYLGDRKKEVSDSTLTFLDQLIPRIEEIQRPVHVIFATDGEITAVPSLWPYLRRLSHSRSVALVSLFSNLSGNFDSMLEGVELSKLSVVASFHAEQLAKRSKGLERFVRTTNMLHERIRKIVVSFILHPDRLEEIRQEMQKMVEAGVPVFAYPLVSIKENTTTYTNEEDQDVNRILEEYNQSESVNFFMMGGRHAGLKCSAGKNLIEINNDGSIISCFMCGQNLGNILSPDQQAFLRRQETTCVHGGCVCNWAVGFSDLVKSKYVRVDSLYGFVKRKGTDDSDPDFSIT